MTELFADTIGDTLKLVPFLLVTYLIMEYLEHKAAGRTQALLRRAGKAGPFLGAAAGLFPQCGFSAAAANFYAARLISRGTLVAVFLATSDEMLPVLLTEAAEGATIVRLLALKFTVGLLVGFLVDFVDAFARRGGQDQGPQIHELCEQEHCDCQAGIVVSALRHTAGIVAFLFLATLLLNLAIFYMGEDSLAAFMQGRPFVSVLLTAAAGLIPNCAPSVIMTKLYLEGALSLGAAMAGLLAGSGTGLLILLRMNRNRRENAAIAGIIYGAGAVTGILLELLG
ncbi:MAG: arsenic efflux protein [Lachnospiraceae bacterium]|nr:arsenic efflux protein [Lachnospiraceae bacterium]